MASSTSREHKMDGDQYGGGAPTESISADTLSEIQSTPSTNDVGATSAAVTQDQGSCELPHHADRSDAADAPATSSLTDQPDMLKVALEHLAKGRAVFPCCSPA